MGWSFIKCVSVDNTSDGTTIDLGDTFNVAEGDLLVAYCWRCGVNPWNASTFSVAKDSGSPPNTFTFDAGDAGGLAQQYNGETWFGYKIAANADAAATFRMTLSYSTTTKGFMVAQFRPDGGETVTKDGSNDATGNGTSTSSGTISTTGTDEIVVGLLSNYGFHAYTGTPQIGAVNATQPTGSPAGGAGHGALFYRILTETMSNGAATYTMDTSDDWCASIIAFKSEAGATTPTHDAGMWFDVR